MVRLHVYLLYSPSTLFSGLRATIWRSPRHSAFYLLRSYFLPNYVSVRRNIQRKGCTIGTEMKHLRVLVVCGVFWNGRWSRSIQPPIFDMLLKINLPVAFTLSTNAFQNAEIQMQWHCLLVSLLYIWWRLVLEGHWSSRLFCNPLVSILVIDLQEVIELLRRNFSFSY